MKAFWNMDMGWWCAGFILSGGTVEDVGLGAGDMEWEEEGDGCIQLCVLRGGSAVGTGNCLTVRSF